MGTYSFAQYQELSSNQANRSSLYLSRETCGHDVSKDPILPKQEESFWKEDSYLAEHEHARYEELEKKEQILDFEI